MAKANKTPIRADKQGEDEEDTEEGNSGMFLEKEDIRLIYNALKTYKPTKKEEHILSVLLESFEEILAVDFTEISY